MRAGSVLLPGAELLTLDEIGYFELIGEGMPRAEAELEAAVRALGRWGIEGAVVPADLPVAVADRLRGEGIAIEVDGSAVDARRRVKTPAELAGIRRAQRAAEAGMAAAEELVRGADREGGRLHGDGEPLTAETVRAAIRAACAGAGAPAPPGIMVVSALSGGGHDPGSGPLPADLPITVDLWPRDEASGRGDPHPRVLLQPRARRRPRGARAAGARARGGETLVAGDVIAIEPGIEGLERIGGVRFEDLLLITDEGSETLTTYPYDL